MENRSTERAPGGQNVAFDEGPHGELDGPLRAEPPHPINWTRGATLTRRNESGQGDHGGLSLFSLETGMPRIPLSDEAATVATVRSLIGQCEALRALLTLEEDMHCTSHLGGRCTLPERQKTQRHGMRPFVKIKN